MTSGQTDDELPVDQLKQYELIRLIDRGPRSSAFLAREPALDRRVTVKLLHPELASDANTVWRFFSQAAVAARLQNPAIAQIYFVGQDGPYCFCVREFINGSSLSGRLSLEDRFSPLEVLDAACQILEGLAVAHQRGIGHGNLHPENVLIDRTQSRFVLTDFQGSEQTQTDSSSTVPADNQLDAQSDLRSLGSLLQLMLDRVATPPSSSESVGLVSSTDLAAFIQRLLMTGSELPFDTAAEALTVARKLGGTAVPTNVQNLGVDAGRVSHVASPLPARGTAIIELPVMEDIPDLPEDLFSGHPASQRRRWWQWFGNRPATNAPSRLQDTHAAVDGALAEMQRRQRWLDRLAVEGQAVLDALQQRVRLNKTPGDASRAAADEVDVAISAQQRQLAEIDHRRAELAQTVERLERQRDLVSERLQIAEAQLHTTDSTPAAKRKPSAQTVIQAGLVIGLFCFAGYLFSTRVTINGLLELLSPPKQPVTRIPIPRETPEKPMPDMSWVPQELTSVPLRALRINTNDKVDRIKFCPGRSIVAGLSDDGVVHVWSAETGDELQRFTKLYRGQFDTYQGLSFSRDGTTLNDWDLTTGRVKQPIKEVTVKNLVSMDYTPNRKQFAAVTSLPNPQGEIRRGSEHVLALYDAESGELLCRVTPGPQEIEGIQFSPIEPLLAYHDGKGRIKLWNAATRQLERELVTPAKKLTAFTFSPDGHYVAASSNAGSIFVWKMDQMTEPTVLKSTAPGNVEFRHFAFSPDNRLIATIQGGVVTLWDVARNEVVRHFLTQQKRVRILEKTLAGAMLPKETQGDNGSVSFSDDGRFLATTGYEHGAPLIWDVSDLAASANPALEKANRAEMKSTGATTNSRESALRRLHYLESVRQTDKPDFQAALKLVAADFTKVEPFVSSEPTPWREVTLNQSGTGFDGIRFTSSLAADADLSWCINLSAQPKEWSIVRLGESIPTFQAEHEAYNLVVPELRVADKNVFTFQSLSGGHIRPGKEYVIWFAFNTREPVVLRFALHLGAPAAPPAGAAPATAPPATVTAEDIAKMMHWNVPLRHTGVPISLEREPVRPRRTDYFADYAPLPFSGQKFPIVVRQGRWNHDD